ncbi:MAG: inorganic diphosphatase [Rhodospirillales bacterium]|nr:inorganic diphosphatase [Rhodospirillales bacterium]
MDINAISIGVNPPDDVNVIIENPMGGDPVKYELDKESGAMFVDRFMHTAMHYPANYGFIPHTLSGDGDPVDVLVMGRVPVKPGAVMACRPIGVLIMKDEAGMDEKIIAVPADRLHPYYNNVDTYEDLRPIQREQIEHFFAHYKDLETGKWSETVGWGGPEEAKKLIVEGIEAARKEK